MDRLPRPTSSFASPLATACLLPLLAVGLGCHQARTCCDHAAPVRMCIPSTVEPYDGPVPPSDGVPPTPAADAPPAPFPMPTDGDPPMDLPGADSPAGDAAPAPEPAADEAVPAPAPPKVPVPNATRIELEAPATSEAPAPVPTPVADNATETEPPMAVGTESVGLEIEPPPADEDMLGADFPEPLFPSIPTDFPPAPVDPE